MPIETIEFNGVEYPKFQSEGNAARWVMPLAQVYCKGVGLDIGYSKDEWKMCDAYGIDNGDTWNATNIPIRRVLAYDDKIEWDFIFSSHCLEHIKENWYNVLDHWLMRIRVGGIIFLYLPHKSQEYWLPKNNRKHIHSFDGSEIAGYLRSLGHKVMLSGVDFNHSFVVVCEKVEKVFDFEPVTVKANKIIAQFGVPDAHGDIIMKGCFDKSIKENDFILTNHVGNEKTYQTFAELEKDIKEEENRQSELAAKKQQCNIIGAFLNDFNRDKIRLDDMLTAIYNAGKNSAL